MVQKQKSATSIRLTPENAEHIAKDKEETNLKINWLVNKLIDEYYKKKETK
ncbi:MAG: transcriptional repressor [Siphoviridae sp. ctjeG17]|nr:MAG: transcriptional repressor [Siphoviridae sp. ctjeG17]